MSNLLTGQHALHNGSGPTVTATLGEDSGLPVAQELEFLREENASLQKRIEEVEQLFIVADKEAEERWAERQKEYEGLIEEKTEVIRALHQKNAELRERAAKFGAGLGDSANPPPPDQPDLARLQRELEEGRRQLADDEESMIGQLRQMEMSLAKDRAELARQRSELQRLQDELKHELEVAARDGGLRDRLGAIRQRASAATAQRPSINQPTPPPSPLPKPPDGLPDKPTRSGIFRRIFGAGQ